jgi:fructose-1,6-bisphosphatase
MDDDGSIINTTSTTDNIKELVSSGGNPLKRTPISRKNPFFKNLEIQDSEKKSNESKTPQFIIKSFKEYMKVLEDSQEERRAYHTRWLHFLRSDESSEPG